MKGNLRDAQTRLTKRTAQHTHTQRTACGPAFIYISETVAKVCCYNKTKHYRIVPYAFDTLSRCTEPAVYNNKMQEATKVLIDFLHSNQMHIPYKFGYDIYLYMNV